MPKYRVYAQKIVHFTAELEADNQTHATMIIKDKKRVWTPTEDNNVVKEEATLQILGEPEEI